MLDISCCLVPLCIFAHGQGGRAVRCTYFMKSLVTAVRPSFRLGNMLQQMIYDGSVYATHQDLTHDWVECCRCRADRVRRYAPSLANTCAHQLLKSDPRTTLNAMAPLVCYIGSGCKPHPHAKWVHDFANTVRCAFLPLAVRRRTSR